jgi:transposase-like protein
MVFKQFKKNELRAILKNIEGKKIRNCTYCGSNVKILKSNSNRLTCSWKGCKRKYCIWTNTIFFKSKINKIKILRILELWMMKASTNIISYVLRISRKSVWNILRKVSKILIPAYYNALDMIGGNNKIIEIDEAKFGKRKYNRGHRVEGVWVLGMIERGEGGKVKLIVIDKRTQEKLQCQIISSVDTNSIIHTDGWKGYNGLDKSFLQHNTVNHSLTFKNPLDGTHTNKIEGTWSGVKIHVPLRGRCKDKINLFLVRYMLLKNEETHPLLSIIKYLF